MVRPPMGHADHFSAHRFLREQPPRRCRPSTPPSIRSGRTIPSKGVRTSGRGSHSPTGDSSGCGRHADARTGTVPSATCSRARQHTRRHRHLPVRGARIFPPCRKKRRDALVSGLDRFHFGFPPIPSVRDTVIRSHFRAHTLADAPGRPCGTGRICGPHGDGRLRTVGSGADTVGMPQAYRLPKHLSKIGSRTDRNHEAALRSASLAANSSLRS